MYTISVDLAVCQTQCKKEAVRRKTEFFQNDLTRYAEWFYIFFKMSNQECLFSYSPTNKLSIGCLAIWVFGN